MRATLSIVSLLSLLVSVQAAVLDNTVVATAIQKAAVDLEGEYQLYNPKTGKYMEFARKDGGSVSMLLSSSPKSVFLNTITSSGDSGTNKGTSGVVISDGMTKCASGAWNFDYDGPNGAHVGWYIPYACALGDYKSRSAATIVDAKQIWQVIPCGSTSGDDNDSSAGLEVNLHVDVTKSTCPKPYDWVCRHPEYVDMHADCKPALKTCGATRFVKRSHKELSNALAKRATKTYCIVATDHLYDMKTRAVQANQIYAFSDIYGFYLDVLDKNDELQQWTITKV